MEPISDSPHLSGVSAELARPDLHHHPWPVREVDERYQDSRLERRATGEGGRVWWKRFEVWVGRGEQSSDVVQVVGSEGLKGRRVRVACESTVLKEVSGVPRRSRA